MIDDVLLLIAGASGAGKTSVREAIAARLTLAAEATPRNYCHTTSRSHRGCASRRRSADTCRMSSLRLGGRTCTGHVVLRWICDAIAGRAPVFRRAPR